jgi:hypothetical protein
MNRFHKDRDWANGLKPNGERDQRQPNKVLVPQQIEGSHRLLGS